MTVSKTRNGGFAFGQNKVDHCECPARSAGFSHSEIDHPDMLDGIRYYDNQLRKETDLDEGIVSEETAKEAWLDAIESCEMKNMNESAYRLEMVAEKLGWV
jgi:hypothetical protein